MHLIIAIVVLFVLYKLFKNYLAEINIFGGIVLALIYYTEVTVYSLIALFALIFVYSKINENNLKKECVSFLQSGDEEMFFERYFNYNIPDRKTIINIISKDFQDSDRILGELFKLDLLKFGCENSKEGDYLLFDKNKCFSELSKTWGESFEVFLNDLNEDPGSGIEIVTMGAVSDNKKIHLIKITKEKEGSSSNDISIGAISLDD